MSDNLDQTSLDALLSATPEQLQEALHLKEQAPPEQPEPVVMPERVINMVSATSGTQLSLRVTLENHLRELESHMMMIPDGQAKHGMRQSIADMRIALAE